MAKNKKSGPISTEEQNFISLNAKTLSPQEIADKLGRNVDTIIKQMGQVNTLSVKGTVLDLERRSDWGAIKSQFTPEEIEIFKSHYMNITSQFKEEIYYTESLQIINAIKYEILSNRILKDQMTIKTEVARLQQELEKERFEDPPNQDRIKGIEFQIASYCGAEVANSKEFRESSTRLMAVLKELKALRSDRISKVEDMKKSFSSFMKGIIEDPLLKKELGSYIEKMRLSQEIELKRLSQPYLYANGEVDRPFLNSTTINLEDEDCDRDEDV